MRMAVADFVAPGRRELDVVSTAADHALSGLDTSYHLDLWPVDDAGLHRTAGEGFTTALHVNHLLATVINQS